jgi:hypothetical protein
MNLTNAVQMYVAEVVAYNNTFKDPNSGNIPDDTINSISVLIKDKDTPFLINNVCPFNSNIKQIPIIGENVLICQGFSSLSTYDKRIQKWYYLQPMSVQSNVNNNIIYNNSTKNTNNKDKVFKETKINALQPYRGDLLIEGRWGNTIRLGSSPAMLSDYSNPPLWKSSKETDPIIILSNNISQPNSNKFHVEHVEKDYSGLYLTSTQQLSTLKLGDSNKRNPLKTYTGESTFKKSQLVGVADRIILKSKTDVAVIDSPKAIVLNTTGQLKVGSDQADIPMVHGDILFKILLDIIKQLKLAPIQCGALVGTFTTTQFADSAQRRLKELLSKKYFITKTK